MIQKIRDFLAQHKLDAVLIARTDSFLGEYYPPEVKQFQSITGFSGSAGITIITPTDKILFVDSRYTEQAKIETDFRVFEVPTETMPSDWIKENLSEKKIGYNPAQRSVLWTEYMANKKINLVAMDELKNLFPIENTPAPATFEYDVTYCGETKESKLEKVANFLDKNKLDAFIFTSPDSVSYLLNERCLWVSEYPVVFKRLVVFADMLYHEYTGDLSDLKGKKIGLDFGLTPVSIFKHLYQQTTITNIVDPVAQMKAIKNPIEQNNIREACLFESLVICRFLTWVEQNKDTITEIDCDKKLKELRSESELYRGDSFDTIAAVGKHAALAHYRADKNSDTRLSQSSILLVDTGGNYLNGTTDMTRTISISEPLPLIKKRYTQVLKGHIALATHIVNQGDTPAELDKLAHSFLRADGVDFGHSTGHGIGMYLAVHEYPPSISEHDRTKLMAGMLFSNEPAFYDIDAGYGIRLENMIMTLNKPNNSLILENLLWIPFDGRLINFEMLTETEKNWLKWYHQEILKRIFPKLSPDEQAILRQLLDFFI